MPNELLFLDFETRSPEDLVTKGQYTYAMHPETDVLVLCGGLDDGAVGTWSPRWAYDVEPSVEEQYAWLEWTNHIRDGGLVVATNAVFDRLIWNYVLVPKYNAPPLPIDQVLCAQAQAEANNLPGRLEKYCEALDTPVKKHPDGKLLIAQLCKGTRADFVLDDETREKMRRFRAYCRDDVESMRQAWALMRPLAAEEWTQYHASERVNDRGCLVDVEFARAAKKYAEIERAEVNDRLKAVTGDKKCTLKAHVRKARWLHDALAPVPEVQALTFRGYDAKNAPRYGASDDIRTLVEIGLKDPEVQETFREATREARARLEEIIPARMYVEARSMAMPLEDFIETNQERIAKQIAGEMPPTLEDVTEFLDAIRAGSGAAIDKFNAILNRASPHDDRVRGQYVFNGAGQTGRFSSRGVQIHNLVRDGVSKDPNDMIEAIEMIVAGEPVEKIEARFGLRIVDLMRRLVRPTFMAAEGKTFVVGDWSQIEARVLPWLSASSGGQAVLDVFASGRDLYTEVADKIGQSRQVGKVAVLSLGYGGSVGAFHGMAKNYGVHLADEEALKVVRDWRATNGWAVAFWGALWDAFMGAWRNPGTWWPAGRVRFLFVEGLMKGTMVCQLPSGRLIHYPELRGEHEIDEQNGKSRFQVTCRAARNGMAIRAKLWPGLLANNATQGTAGDFLRGLLVDLDPYNVVVLHTHDEVVLEVPTERGEEWVARLSYEMMELPAWAEGLPLDCDISVRPFYAK